MMIDEDTYMIEEYSYDAPYMHIFMCKCKIQAKRVRGRTRTDRSRCGIGAAVKKDTHYLGMPSFTSQMERGVFAKACVTRL